MLILILLLLINMMTIYFSKTEIKTVYLFTEQMISCKFLVS